MNSRTFAALLCAVFIAYCCGSPLLAQEHAPTPRPEFVWPTVPVQPPAAPDDTPMPNPDSFEVLPGAPSTLPGYIPDWRCEPPRPDLPPPPPNCWPFSY